MDDWQAILTEHRDAVWRRAYRLLGNEADAADCFQDTFAAAVAVAGREPVRNWRGLLVRLATCGALAILRRRTRRGRDRVYGVDLSAVVGSEAGPDERAQQAELAEHVREAIALLPGRQGEVCCLRYLDELTCEEIASQLDLRENNVRVLLHRARSRLRALLAESAVARGK